MKQTVGEARSQEFAMGRGAVPGVMGKEEQKKKGLHLQMKQFISPNSVDDQKNKKQTRGPQLTFRQFFVQNQIKKKVFG